VAELAGIPRPVIRRASELLADLEARQLAPDSATDQPAPTPAAPAAQPAAPAAQLSLFDIAPNPVVEYVKRLNINELSPLEALTKLYELQQLAQTPVNE
jgi:DNA mismatch repair protein MutS